MAEANSPASIPHLPYEILSHIFLESLPLEPVIPHHSLPPLLFTNICSDWRKIAISTQQLWSAFTLSFKTTTTSDDSGIVQLFSCWLARSGSCPLTLKIEARRRHPTFYSIPSVVIHTLNDCSSRWCDMHFELSMRDMCQLDPKDGLPSLQRLGLEDCTGWGDLELPFQTFKNAPALRHLYLGGDFDLGSIELPVQQVLRVDTGWQWRLQYFHILETLPNIEGIHMGVTPVVSLHHTGPLVPGEIHSNIRTLALSLPDDESYIDTLDFLTCPALESLTVSLSNCKAPIPAASIMGLISRSSPPLRELHIENPHANEAVGDFMQCLMVLPTLEALSAKALSPATARDILRRMNDSSDSTPFLPHLQRLDIGLAPLTAEDEWTFEEVLQTLVSRWNVQSPGDVARLQAFTLASAASWRANLLPLPSPDPVVLAQLEVSIGEGMVVEMGDVPFQG